MRARPNILWIVADHLIHASRPKGFDQFPLQQKMTELGTSFTRAYSVLPICSPARASMLTGLYPHAHGLTENDGRFGGRSGLDPDIDWMIQQPLKVDGYRCGWFGKWHIDNHRSALDYGFEGWSLPGYGYPYADSTYRDYLDRQGLRNPQARITVRNESGLPAGTEINLVENSQWFDYVSGVAKLEGPAEAHEAFFVSDMAVQWIDSMEDESFFLRVDPWGPHPPYLLADSYEGIFEQCEIKLPENFHSNLEQRPDHHRTYRDFWTEAVGHDEEYWRKLYQHALEHIVLVETALCRLLDHVDLDNTLVIFNSDHGDAVGTNGGIANKGDLMVEATMQIPLMFAGYGIPQSRQYNQLVSQVDIVPTLLEYCGLPDHSPRHGKSLRALLENREGPWRKGLLAQHYGLIEPIVQRAWYRDNFKLIVGKNGFCELYDLENDPGEIVNLAEQFDCQELFQKLLKELFDAMDDVDDTDCDFQIGARCK